MPSILITSITNALAFSSGWTLLKEIIQCALFAGAFSNTPAVERFCTITSVAVFVDTVLQLTFYGGVMAWAASRQEEAASKKGASMLG